MAGVRTQSGAASMMAALPVLRWKGQPLGQNRTVASLYMQHGTATSPSMPPPPGNNENNRDITNTNGPLHTSDCDYDGNVDGGTDDDAGEAIESLFSPPVQIHLICPESKKNRFFGRIDVIKT